MVTRRQRQQHRERWTGKRAADLDPEHLQRAAADGYEPGPDGYMVGRDPRDMDKEAMKLMGHEPMSPTQAIRARCFDCAGTSHEIRLCVAVACPSWPFRLGSNPWRAEKTEAQIEASRRAGERLREAAKQRRL